LNYSNKENDSYFVPHVAVDAGDVKDVHNSTKHNNDSVKTWKHIVLYSVKTWKHIVFLFVVPSSAEQQMFVAKMYEEVRFILLLEFSLV
jgi:hypothetical protein